MSDPHPVSELQAALGQLMQSGTTSNPALNRLIDDYRTYHLVFVVFGSIFVLCFLLLSVSSLRRSRSLGTGGGRRWTFERRACLCLGASSAILGVIMAVIVVGNLSNVLDPRAGFSGSVGMIGAPPSTTVNGQLHQAFTTWLQSGTRQMPALVQARIDDRLAWQRPKAIICGVLLLVLIALGARIWFSLIGRSRVRSATWRDRCLLGAGVGVGLGCLLLMLMVLGNTQASVAPLTMTLVFG